MSPAHDHTGQGHIEDGHTAEARAEREGGFVLVWMATMLVVLIAFAGFSIDVGHWYLVASRVQKAADSAALGGVVFVTGDFAAARNSALDLAARHGYDNDGGDDSVTVAPGDRPNQLRVTIRTTVDNFFIGVLGIRTQSITRTALAEFEGPVPMGSPSNNLGNQPIGPGDEAWDSGLSDPESSDPQVWANIAGRDTNKHNGDRHASNLCALSPNVYECSGSNLEHAADGYFYSIRVRADGADVSRPLAIEVYDPAFVQSGDRCNDLDGTGGEPVALTSAMVALGERYDPTQNSANNKKYCPGDHYVTSQGGPFPTTTYTVRAPDDTPWIDTDNPVITSGSCTPQTFAPFRGATTGPNTLPAQIATAGSYAGRVYHRWVRVCEVSLASAGVSSAGTHDLVLQVDTGAGSGHNRYAIRAGFPGAGASGDGRKVSVFANGRLPLYANAIGANSQFYLARVMPGGGSRTLAVGFYDVGDVSGVTGTIEVLPPPDSNLSAFGGGGLPCRVTVQPNATPAAATTQNGCRITGVSSTRYQAQLVEMSVPIPSNYTCDSSDPAGCWVRVRMNYPLVAGSTVGDTTTWSAGIVGDPVRLVE